MRVPRGGAEVTRLQREQKKMVARFNVSWIEAERPFVPLGGFGFFAASSQEVAQSGAEEGVAGILLQKRQQVLLPHRGGLGKGAVEQYDLATAKTFEFAIDMRSQS